jgi:membrane protease YdiL (CAAX protease family)
MTNRRLRLEVWVVLGLSLGQSAVYAVVSLVAAMTRGPLADATATLNRNQSEREWLDLVLQVLSIGFALVPVVLVVYLLSADGEPLRRLGLERRRPVRALAVGTGLALAIGLPGLGLYALGRALGMTAQVIPVPDHTYWWTVPVLILAAIENAVVEEVIAVGYLVTRLRDLRWAPWAAIVASALLRGSYHLYQGFGQALGNVAMGLVFAWWFQRTKRLLPLIVAHTLLDVVAFVGYLWFADDLSLR